MVFPAITRPMHSFIFLPYHDPFFGNELSVKQGYEPVAFQSVERGWSGMLRSDGMTNICRWV